MPPKEEHNRIDELNKSLYSRTGPDVRTRRKLRLADSSTEVKSDWEHPKEEEATEEPVLNEKYKDRSMSFFTKLFIASLAFCIITVGVGVYLFLNGANLISANNIGITINGPVSIAGGSPVSFDVNVANNNSVPLQLVDMSVTFPDGTADPNNPTKPLTTYQKLLGDMPPGAATTTSFSAVIFGEENIQKEIQVTLTYNIKGSSSVFTKTQVYDVLISSSPINVTASSFKEITSGQDFDMKVTLKSNSQSSLRNIILHADYPFGYTFKSSDLPPFSDNATWAVGDLPAGSSRTITIHGVLQGEDTDIRAFHFTVGSAGSANSSAIATQYTAVEQDMTIQKPFISLALSINNDQSTTDYIGGFEQPDSVNISWFNNLSTSVSNAVITAKLSGTAYDKNAIQPNGGRFDSANDEIIWNQQTTPGLASIGAGESGSVSFIITPKHPSGTGVNNPSISISANVSGNRTQESNVPGSLTAVAGRNISISSNVSLSGRIVRTVGPFVNAGPVPPKAESTTTYTVVWTIDNTSNAVTNAQVTAALPAYVSLINFNSSSENTTFDRNSGLITWNVGNLTTYTNSASGRRELDFQIAFQPGANQIGQVPTLVNKATLTAQDSFTGAELTSTQDYLTTRYSTDPGYKPGDEIVTQ